MITLIRKSQASIVDYCRLLSIIVAVYSSVCVMRRDRGLPTHGGWCNRVGATRNFQGAVVSLASGPLISLAIK